MSVAFLTAAFSARIGKSTTKSVLIAIADRADDKTGYCFPSTADIIQRTELDRKTVLNCMKSLEESGFISDTKKRVGATNQVKIWKLDINKINEASQNWDTSTKPSQKRNRSVFAEEQSRFSSETVPETGHVTTTEPSFNHHPKNQVVVDMDDLIKAAVWAYQKGGKKIENLTGFQHSVRKRLKEAVTPEDISNLQKWQNRDAPSPNLHVKVEVVEKSGNATKEELEKLPERIKRALPPSIKSSLKIQASA